MKKKDVKLWKYGISTERYRQLHYFCRQYPEWKSKTNYGLSAVVNDGMPHGNNISNPTQAQAFRNEKWVSNINLVEETAREADETIWRNLIDSVCYGTTYEQMQVPSGRRQFYEARRKFFYILDLKMP